MTELAWRMRRLAARVALVSATVHLVGCGTIVMATSTQRPGESTLQNGCNITRVSPCSHLSHVYAGAAYDACTAAWAVRSIPHGLATDTVATIAYAPAFLGLVGLLTLDLPVSLVADTLRLPATTSQQAERGDVCPAGWQTILPAGPKGAHVPEKKPAPRS